ncbi:GspH/FimT family pseudopilin [Massilia sp. W12]|uniref:GspH/FimT family pseudopilin n=1 Tax=Massilia sp. W12 TaxID=3126507 RepID=UPI0030D5C1F5
MSRLRQQAAFTLLELMVVMAIIGLMLGVVSFNAMPSDRQLLQRDAERIALLLQTARDEAIVRNRQIMFEANGQQYYFRMRENGQWVAIPKDDMLKDREFERPGIRLSMQPAPADGGSRIIFGREPVDKPFVLTLASGEVSASIRADGIGHFTVE